MPIRPDQAVRYPSNWREISNYIRFDRAEGRCECRGECGSSRHLDWQAEAAPGLTRCPAIHGQPSPLTGSPVVLTTAHLDHTPENCEPDNLRAMCQACHLAYDKDHHATTRAASKLAKPPPSVVHNGQCPGCQCGWNGPHPANPEARDAEMLAIARTARRG